MTRVVVVGAGPVGVASAILLAQRGVRCLVLDRYEEPYSLPRAVHVDDEVVRILQELGVAEDFLRVSRPGLGLRLLDGRHRVMAEFRRGEAEGPHGYPQANMFDQPDLERLLRARLAELDTVEFVGGAEVTAVTWRSDPTTAGEERAEARAGDGPAVEVARGGDRVAGEAARHAGGVGSAALVRYRMIGSGEERVEAADFVLGCDGANSTVRGIIGAELEDLRFEERWLVVDGVCADDLRAWGGVHQVCDPRRAATFMQLGALRYRWEFRLHPGESTVDVEELLAPWLGGVAVRVVRRAEYTFRARLADRWRAGPVFLLGDAAHQTPPFIGQGLGAGLRDAYNLAWKLAAGDPRLLDTYEAERKPHARAQIRLAIVAGWAMTGGQDRAAAVRRVVLGAIWRLPGLKGLALRSTSPPLRLARRTAGPATLPTRWTGEPAPRLEHRAADAPQAARPAADAPQAARPAADASQAARRTGEPAPQAARRAGWLVRGRRAGRLAPQPRVVWEGREVRLDEVLGSGWATLYRRRPGIPPVGRALEVTAELDPSGALRRWLRGRTVVLRPDRVVARG